MKMIQITEPLFLPELSLKAEFTLPKMGVVLLSGENGIGKSTFCSYLYEKGILGEDVIWTESAQFRSIYPISVKAVVSTFLENCQHLDKKRYDDLRAIFRVSEWEERSWPELSSGQGQMLKLLLGLSLNAKTYLLDEPAHFLDKEKLKGLSQIVCELGKESLVVIVDHRFDWFEGEMIDHYRMRALETTLLLEKQ